ncbi:MAG: hypothetical protein Kow0089_00470 [Desulfobulbaceae bacterium]
MKMKGLQRYSLMIAAALLVTGLAATSFGATLTASTSLTVVNVTKFPSSYDITHWTGYWPNSPDDTLTSAGAPGVSGKEVYLDDVHFTSHHMSWMTTPYATPYTPFPNTVNSMICAVWSDDGGKTFSLQSWDYLQRTTHGKGTEGGMPNCWMGTMVHSLCDRKPGECNGRYRSNLYFSEWPTGNTNCWGLMD